MPCSKGKGKSIGMVQRPLLRESQTDVVYLGWPIAPSYMSPNAGGGGLRGLSQWVQLCTWSPNKLWRSNSIFNQCHYSTTAILPNPLVPHCTHTFKYNNLLGLPSFQVVEQIIKYSICQAWLDMMYLEDESIHLQAAYNRTSSEPGSRCTSSQSIPTPFQIFTGQHSEPELLNF